MESQYPHTLPTPQRVGILKVKFQENSRVGAGPTRPGVAVRQAGLEGRTRNLVAKSRV